MNSKLSLFTLALLLFSWSAIAIIPPNSGNSANSEIEAILTQGPMRGTQVGIFAVNFAGDTLVNINAGQRLVPASNVKLITTGIALKVLGKDYRYSTSLGYSGEIVEGVLNGDLYIIGGGDPTTGAKLNFVTPVDKLFASWKNYLEKAGIIKINGRIIGDDRFFEFSCAEPISWQSEDIGYYFGSGPKGLNFYENAQIFTISPGLQKGDNPNISIYYPETPWLEIVNYATTGSEKTPNSLYYQATPLAPIGGFSGSFPIDRKRHSYEAANRFGPLTCAYYFYNYLIDNGIEVEDYADIDANNYLRQNFICAQKAVPQDSLTLIGSTQSPSLGQIIIETNHESDNFFAETLFRTIGRSLNSNYKEDFGVKALNSELQKLGLRPKDNCQIVDGSGLSRNNYISPSFFVNFLLMMSRDEDNFPAYFRSIPMPGSKSTLEYKFGKYPEEFKYRIKMKSGSMNGVQSYTGYILSSDGDPEKTIAFSIICNNFLVKSSSYMPYIDSIIEILTTQN